MAASKSGTTSSSDAQSGSNSNKTIENSLIKHQGQKWQQFYDFDKMLKQIRVTEKQHYRSSTKGDSSSSHNNGKSGSSSSHGSSSSSSKSSSTSSSKNGRSIRQVQRLCGNDMHYYGIIPKHTASDVIVCSSCRGSYTKVGFNNHMMMQHPAAWGAASSKLSHTTSANDVYNLISNDNSQDCIRDVSSATTTVTNEILGSPSDLSGIMSTSSNASSSSSQSTSTSSNTYTAMTGRHKSSKSSGTTGGSSSSGSSSSRSRSKQSRHSSSSNNNHATSIGIHTSSSTANAEATQTPSKSSKKSSSSTNNSTSSSSISSSSNNNKNDTKNHNTAALAITSTLTVTTTNAVPNASSASKHSKETTTTASLQETAITTATTNPIALYSSSSNSSCSLPPTPKLSTILAEVKSPAVALQELADSSVSSSSADYERAASIGKTSLSSKANHTPTTTGKANTTSASPYSSSTNLNIAKQLPNVSTVKEMTHFDAQQLSELDQAVSSITDGSNEEESALGNNKTAGSNKTIIDTTTNIMTTTSSNMFQIPTTTNTITEPNNEKTQDGIVTPIAPSNNMNVPPPVTTNYVVPQEVVQACENALAHNTSDDNSILTFDDVFDSKFINEILSTADTDIHFDENELDTASVVQQQQQQQQLDQNQMYQQQQQVPTAKRMRYDETLLENGTTVGQQQLPLQQHQHGMPGVEITGEFVAYQQQTQLQQQPQQYMPYNVASLDDLKMFNAAGTMLEQHQQQMPTHLQQQQQHVNEQQQQQLTAIDAMQLQQLLYQQQTLNTHFDNSGAMINDGTALQHQQQNQQSYDGSSGVVSAKQLLDMCGATVDMKTNKMMNDFTLSTAAGGGGGYESVDGGVGTYEHMTANFQLYNVPSLTDDNETNVEERGGHLAVNDGVCETTNIMMPNLMNGMQQQQQRGCAQQFVLPGGVVGSGAEEQLIYEITDNNQVAVISQQRQQQMLNEFLTQANYEQQKIGGSLDMNSNAGAALDISTNAGIMLQQPNNNNNENNISIKETVDDIDADILDFDYTLMDTVKGISSSSSNGKAIKSEFNTSGGSSSSSGVSGATSNSKSYEDLYLNTYLYAGIPKPIAINCFGLIKLPFAAATTFRKHILNTRKANNSPITLSGGGGINGIVCGNSSTAARNSTKSMQNYFSNLTSSSSSNNALASGNGNEFSIGSITITNSTVSQQSQLFAAQQKQQSNGGNSGSNASNSGGMEITFNTNSNGCGSASMSPVSSSAPMQRSRSKSGNNSTSGTAGGATLVRSKSQTGAPVAVITPTNRLPLPPPRPSTAGPVLAQSSKTIFVSNSGMSGSSNDRMKFIKRCMPLVSSSNNNTRSEGGSKRPKFSPRQIADLLGGVSGSGGQSINNKSAGNHKSSAATTDVTINGINSNHEINNANTNNNSNSSNAITTPNNCTLNSDSEQLKSERVARFYERRRKLYDMARTTRQQQHQQQQRTQPPQLQQKLLKQQHQLFKMLTDYGQLSAVTPTPVVGNCKGANANANGGNNNNSNSSEILRISV